MEVLSEVIKSLKNFFCKKKQNCYFFPITPLLFGERMRDIPWSDLPTVRGQTVSSVPSLNHNYLVGALSAQLSTGQF